jgi:hypothetical protein
MLLLKKIIKPVLFYLSVVAAIAIAINLAYKSGVKDGRFEKQIESSNQYISRLENIIDTTDKLIVDAKAVSLELGEIINKRIETDAKTTQEIRNALSTTAHLRVECVLPTNVVHTLASARERANKAATTGISTSANDPVPAAAGASQ